MFTGVKLEYPWDAATWVYPLAALRPKYPTMKSLDPATESAVRAFLARLPVVEYAILYGSRATGSYFDNPIPLDIRDD
jgi:hypothetical protein